ncbi:Werner Syndrome-like exonuclease [Populus alba x Populus x berolinensis]|uniref:3'-5' exonuclease n=1 Tax=Populus alba x Populus x berolinensis TaxID=444605 RepID=A0AAD6LF31_9ROSI|nr:Werner Syndrome-like exonuclease [Populus alba x Populus x berolinensis]
MNSRQHETNNNSKINWSPILDWDQPLTDQELEAIDAIEASFQSSTPSSSSSSTSSTPAATTPSSSVIKKRHSSPQKDQEPPKTRRQLPNSIFSLSKPFSLSPCQGNVKMRYPAMKFGGQILYSRTSIEVEKAARELLQSLEAEKREMDRVIIGFDIEWKPSFTTVLLEEKGVLPGKAAVMQICANTSLCHVGIGIGGDCAKVFRDYNVSVKSVEDLSYLANQKLDGKPKTWGLQALAKILVCKELQKPNKIRLGNWQVDVLSKEQLQYAATDAFASWQLYQVLKSLPDAKDATDPTSKELKVFFRIKNFGHSLERLQ